MTQEQKAKKLGVSLSTYKRVMKDIKHGQLLKPNILKILRVQGKGELIDKFIKEVQG